MACGALGAYEPVRVRALALALERSAPAAGVRLREVHADERSILWLDREPIRWENGESHGVAWAESHPGPGRTPRDRHDAAMLGTLGLERSGERRAIYTSVSGVGPLYWRTAGDATYFCTRVEPLLEVAPGKVEADLETWACILTLGYHPGERTPFEEIRRVGELATLEHVSGRGARVEPERWPWAEIEPDGTPHAEIAELVLADLRATIGRLDPRQLWRVPLSGGWDSRLLAIMASQAHDRIETYTINPDKGTDKEERFAAAVARGLGIHNQLIQGDTSRFREELRFAMEAQEHQAPLHLPLARLALELEPREDPILEGVAGDMFLKAVYVTDPMAAPSSWEDVVGGVWTYFVRDRAGRELFGPERWAALAATGRAALDREAERFRGHPSAATLVYYTTRTRRAAAVAPLDLFGRVGPVTMPFLSHDLVAATLRVPLTEKNHGDFYREVLRRADPIVGLLPSSNDPDHKKLVAETPRLRNQPEAIAAYAEIMERHPAAELFGPELRDALAGDQLERFVRGGGRLRGLYALLAMGAWLERHADRLKPVELSRLG